MTSWIFTALLVACLPVVFGAWATLVGFGFIGKVTAVEQNPRFRAGRVICRFAGPLLIAAGFWLAAQPLVAPEFGLNWQTYVPTGERFSIDLPGRPVEAVVEEQGEYGPVENRLARVFLWRLDVTYTLRRTSLPERFPKMSRDETAKWLRDQVVKMAGVNHAAIIENKEVPRGDGIAREFRVDLKNGFLSRGEILLLGRTRFELTCVAPASLVDSKIADRFFDSFSCQPATSASTDRAADIPSAGSAAEREN